MAENYKRGSTMTPEIRAKKIMQRLNISRRSMSETLGISVSSVTMYFTGHHKIRRVVALGMQACYGINADYIMQGKLPVFVKQPGLPLSREAMEMAVIYEDLPKRIQPTARTTMLGLSRLRTTQETTSGRSKSRRASMQKSA